MRDPRFPHLHNAGGAKMAQRIDRRPWAVPAWSFSRVQLVRPPRSCIRHKAFAAFSTPGSGADSWPATPPPLPPPPRSHCQSWSPLEKTAL